ncbi:MAG: ABC transporter substrate-binding protein [Planctomycetes bacterium]|nr:ABC transporter substrate-binding protein [Planctomycetota bacterium]
MLIALLLGACSHEGDLAQTAAARPQRIVALTVGAADTLALLGELERVVAVEEDCFVPGTEKLVRIRNDDHAGPSKALNVEAVFALHPDLVIAKEDLQAALGGRGMDVLWVPQASDLAAICGIVEEIGARLGVKEKSDALLAELRERAARIRARVAGQASVRVYYEAGRPGRTAGKHTVIDEMIRLAGGVNIAGDQELANPTLSSEAIVAADPEVIVLSPWSDTPEQLAQRPGWSGMRAVREGRVYQIPERDRQVQYPSPSCVEGCERLLVPWLHPSAMGGK